MTLYEAFMWIVKDTYILHYLTVSLFVYVAVGSCNVNDYGYGGCSIDESSRGKVVLAALFWPFAVFIVSFYCLGKALDYSSILIYKTTKKYFKSNKINGGDF